MTMEYVIVMAYGSANSKKVLCEAGLMQFFKTLQQVTSVAFSERVVRSQLLFVAQKYAAARLNHG